MWLVGNRLIDGSRDLRDTIEEKIAEFARFISVARSERNADALLRVVGFMDGVVAPPRAVVVPDVVIVGRAAVCARAELRRIHAHISSQGVGHMLSQAKTNTRATYEWL